MAALLPAGSEAEEARAGRDTGDANAIVALGGDDSGDPGAMVLGNFGLSGDEVAVDDQLPGKVGMIGLDSAVDHRDPDPAARRLAMEIRKVPGFRRGLGGV